MYKRMYKRIFLFLIINVHSNTCKQSLYRQLGISANKVVQKTL